MINYVFRIVVLILIAIPRLEPIIHKTVLIGNLAISLKHLEHKINKIKLIVFLKVIRTFFTFQLYFISIKNKGINATLKIYKLQQIII